MNETPQAIRGILNSADATLGGVITEVEGIVGTPTQEWTFLTRKLAMERLAQTADQALVCFDEWIQKGILIKSTLEIVRCLDSIKTMARYAAVGDSRCWGRTSLKQDATRLKDLLGDGCETGPPELHRKDQRKDQPRQSLMAEKSNPSNNSVEYLSIYEVAAILNVSPSTVRRHFADRSGVIDLGRRQGPKRQRPYRFLRIPRVVLNRFLCDHRIR